jgi:rSAM/selenodomain-associated transferase 1
MAERRHQNLLIVFARNPVQGKVKTRLAGKIGEEKAFRIYLELLDRTRKVVLESDADSAIFYDAFIDYNDQWDNNHFHKFLQSEGDLGSRMLRAMEQGLSMGYRKVCLVGSDIPGLQTVIIDNAFVALDKGDVVIGPAKDGGYYLIGFKVVHPELFENIPWSTGDVFRKTREKAGTLDLDVKLIQMLQDLDEPEDLASSDFQNLL